METQKLRFAGDVTLDKVNVISANGLYQDITAQILSIQIFEDMFSPFITGKLVVRESLDLINLFPFVGEETLELQISTPSLENSKISSKFYIFKMTNRDMMGDRVVAYELHFSSTDSIIDINKSISRAFSGKISDIAKTILTDINWGLQVQKPLNIEETSNNLKYVSNFWSPIKNLYHLVDIATNKNKSPTYLFFENREGYNFVSLESLFKQEVMQEFTKDNYIRDELSSGGSVKDLQKDYQRIETITVPVAFDYLSRVRSGMFGSKQYYVDYTGKRIGSKNFDLLKTYEKRGHLNKYPLASKKTIYRYNTKIDVVPKMNSSFYGYSDTSNAAMMQERMSVFKQIESTRLEITVPGRLDYTVGKKVKLNMPRISPISKGDTDTEDKTFSGNYLIAAINHYIDRERHVSIMELVKDSTNVNYEDVK